MVDSGATHHMCNNREAFRKNSLGPAHATVRLGVKSLVEAAQQGTVTVNEIELSALLIPEFRVPLLSVAQLDVGGLELSFLIVCAQYQTLREM